MKNSDLGEGRGMVPRPTVLVHRLLEGVVTAGDLAIDATCGNGHDTLFLARCVGPTGRVLAFDIQEAALASTRRIIEGEGLSGRVSFHLESHASLADHAAPASVAAIMFNLGYLPGGDHSVMTQRDETLAGLRSATEVLKAGGWLCVICYPGHTGGDVEAESVEEWMSGLAVNGWRVARYGMIGTRKAAPFLLIAAKAG